MQIKKVKAIGIKKNAKNPETIPYHRKPTDLSLEAWQIALRKQFVTGKNFVIRKFDGHPYSVIIPCIIPKQKTLIKSPFAIMIR